MMYTGRGSSIHWEWADREHTIHWRVPHWRQQSLGWCVSCWRFQVWKMLELFTTSWIVPWTSNSLQAVFRCRCWPPGTSYGDSQLRLLTTKVDCISILTKVPFFPPGTFPRSLKMRRDYGCFPFFSKWYILFSNKLCWWHKIMMHFLSRLRLYLYSLALALVMCYGLPPKHHIHRAGKFDRFLKNRTKGKRSKKKWTNALYLFLFLFFFS